MIIYGAEFTVREGADRLQATCFDMAGDTTRLGLNTRRYGSILVTMHGRQGSGGTRIPCEACGLAGLESLIIHHRFTRVNYS
jgi:hypothetical protein